MSGRYVTAEPFDLAWEDVAPRRQEERFRLYRVCLPESTELELLATCATEEAVGVALCTLGREGEYADQCAFGILDTMGEVGKKWLVKPWRAMPRELSEAGRVLGSKTFGIRNE